MPFDPTLPLQAGPPAPQQYGPDWNQIAKLQELQYRTQLEQQEVAGQNAIRNLYMNPQNFGPNGMPTPNALRGIMMASPETGVNFASKLYEQMGAQQRLKSQGQAQYDKVQKDWLSDVVSPAIAVYNKTRSQTGSDNQAQESAQKVMTEGRDEFISRGLIPATDVDRLLPRQFDYPRMNARVLGVEGMQKYNQSQQREQREQKRLDFEQQRSDREQAKYRREEKGNVEPVIAHDPQGKTYSTMAYFDKDSGRMVDANTGQVVNVIGKQPTGGSALQPKTQAFNDFKEQFRQDHGREPTAEEQAQFIQSEGSYGRSAPAIAARKFIEEHPDATAEQVVGFSAKMNQAISASRAWGSGPQGNTIRALNNVVDHFDTMNDAMKALNNNNVTFINRLRNVYKDQSGQAGPNNFRFIKQIVGDEVVKAIMINGVGGVTDRAGLQSSFNESNSPRQLEGVVEQAKRLLSGQYRNMRRQYDTATFGGENGKYGIPTFDSWMSEPAREAYGKYEKDDSESKSIAGPTIVAPSGQGNYPPITPPAVAHLRQNPSTRAQFDEIFGPGAAERILGAGR